MTIARCCRRKAALFQLISARLSWLSQRQGVLSQNIANADTPDYQPQDLRAADFARLVEGFAGRPGRYRAGADRRPLT